jgi:ribosomal protein L11 methyltransferase
MKKMMNNDWLKITVSVDPALLDPVSDFLIGVVGGGVEEAAVDEPGYGTLHCYHELTGPVREEVEPLLRRIEAHLKDLEEIFEVSGSVVSWELLEEEDWSKIWKEHFKPFAIVPGLVIVPSWEQYSPVDNERVITMDPGMAFGTGHHATTSLCLELLRGVADSRSNLSLLDVGTGTGILAIAGILSGCGSAVGLDNDPDAVRVAQENVVINDLEDRINISIDPLEKLKVTFDLVVANIVHDVLVEMADGLVGATATGGALILSGILAGDQVKSIVSVFEDRGMQREEIRQREEWASLLFRKK